MLVNNEGVVTLINNQTEKLFGYDRKELVGNHLEILIPERLRIHNPDIIKKPQLSFTNAGRDLFALRKNGTEMQVEISLNPIETTEGPMELLSINDITERKIQEATLIKQNIELEQFAYVASHDLQEPLRTVSNYMELFEEDYLERLDVHARQYLNAVNNATKRMSTVIKSQMQRTLTNLLKKYMMWL